MLTFAEMKTQVSNRISIVDSGYENKIGEWLNYRYDDIIGRHDWPQLYRTDTVILKGGEGYLSLPREVDVIINIHDRTNGVSLTPLNPSAGARGYLQDQRGLTTMYWWEGITVFNQPPTKSVISVSSKNNTDQTQTIRIWGKDEHGAEISDTVELQGTSPVDTLVEFVSVDRISKDMNTKGLVQGVVGSTTIFSIDPYNYGATKNRIRVLQQSDADIELTIIYKRKVPRLINPEDIPMLDCSQALVLGAYISALRQQREHAKAKTLEYNPQEPYDPTTYEGKVRSLIQRFEQQAENVPLFRPMIDRYALDRPWRT